MKKCFFPFVVLFLAVVFLLFSCGKSNEEKAKKLTEDKIKESLYIPESYELASFELDSAFAPYDDPSFFALAIDLAKDDNTVRQAQTEIEHANSEIALWSGPYQTSYDINKKNQAKNRLEQAKQIEEDATEHGKEVVEKIGKIVGKAPCFIGMKARVSFRAKNNNGQILMGKAKVLFDKEVSKIVEIYDMDSEEYQVYTDICNEIDKN